jgi:galactose mutarotase-like enzyme
MAASGTVESKKENVLIRAGECAVTVLPRFGGKISSICVHNRELLQAPLAPVRPRTRTMSFDQGDASGWDECLPSVAACTVKTQDGVAQIPDHGDLWREPWELQGTGISEQGSGADGPSSITLRGECFSLPLTLKRTTALAETKKGWRLQVDYKLTNAGCNTAPWSWAAHPLFAVDEGDRIEIPASIAEMRVEGSGGGRLDGTNGHVAWPKAKLTSVGTTDLSIVQARASNIGDKLFGGPLRAEDNWCVLHRQKAGFRIRMSFDTAATPYLGLWLCYGGWPERPGAKQMCVAPEPSTAPVDSLAHTGKWSRELGPGESSAWLVSVDIEVL